VQWAGGFTGADGRSFAESVGDALDAVEAARVLGASVVVLHSGCRGGHTRSHARRLLVHAIAAVEPAAARAGVTLALKPLHPAAAADCSFLTSLAEALEVVEECRAAAVRPASIGLAVDLWHFADDPAFEALLPAVAAATAVVQVADRTGPPTPEQERLPPGHGSLPLQSAVSRLVSLGFSGWFEFDPVGEAVEVRGYDAVLADVRQIIDDWSAAPGDGDSQPVAAKPQRARTGAGLRRSHASSQAVSRG
jgi:sugar phosphate isomerase/epimerase